MCIHVQCVPYASPLPPLPLPVLLHYPIVILPSLSLNILYHCNSTPSSLLSSPLPLSPSPLPLPPPSSPPPPPPPPLSSPPQVPTSPITSSSKAVPLTFVW